MGLRNVSQERHKPEMTNRQSSIEVTRIISALGIVWFHSGVPGGSFGYAGLTVFLILTTFFEFGPNLHRRYPLILQIKRLIIPFLFWSIVYAIVNVFKNKPAFGTNRGIISAILTGPSVHLWYLPYVSAMLAIATVIKCRFSLGAIKVGAGITLVIILFLSPFLVHQATLLGRPAPQWLYAFPPLLLGVILGADKRLAVALYAVLILAIYRFDSAPIQYLGGMGLIHIALLIRWRSSFVNTVSSLMMGVYLVHPLALSIFRPLAQYSEIVFVLFSFFVSTVSVYLFVNFFPQKASLILGTGRHKVAGHS